MSGSKRDIQLKKIKKITKIVLRVSLGIIFVYASKDKILNPSDFATILYGYSIFPLFSINIIAIVFPFIELVTGVALIFGIYSKPALIIINFLISFFIIIISFNLLRGHEFNCGCFAVGDQNNISAAGQLLIRNLILLIVGLYLLFDRLHIPYNSKS